MDNKPFDDSVQPESTNQPTVVGAEIKPDISAVESQPSDQNAPVVSEPAAEVSEVSSAEVSAEQQSAEMVSTPGPVPAPASPVVASSAPAAMPTAPKKTGLKAGVVAFAAVLIAGAAGAAAYFGYIVPNKPENILAQAAHNMLVDNVSQSKTEVSISASGVSATVTLDASINAEKKVAQMALELNAMGVKVPAEVRYIEGNTYVKLDDLKTVQSLAQMYIGSDPSVASMVDQLVQKVEGKWIEINKTMIESSDEAKCMLAVDWLLSEDDVQAVKDAYEKNSFVKIASHDDDKVDDKAAIKYVLELDADKANKFAADKFWGKLSVVKAIEKCMPESSSTGLDVEDVEQSIQDAFDDTLTDKIKLTMWVDKDSKRFVKQQIEGEVEGGTYKVVSTIGYEKVTVEKPSGPVPLMQLISETQTLMGGGSSLQSPLTFDGL